MKFMRINRNDGNGPSLSNVLEKDARQVWEAIFDMEDDEEDTEKTAPHTHFDKFS